MKEAQKILKVIKSGNREKIDREFSEIYEKYKGLVCFILTKYIDNQFEIDDLLQESFISVFNNIDRIKTDFKGYIASISKNKALNYLKQKKKYCLLSDAEIDKSVLIDETRSNLRLLIDDLNKKLNEEEVNIIIYHLVYDYTFKDIAINLNMKESTIKTKYFRALRKYNENKKGK